MKTVVAAFIACAGLASPGLAAADPVDELMHKSGLWKQIGEFEPTMQAGIAQSQWEGKRLDEDALRALRRAAAAGYAPDRMRAAVSRQIASELAPRDIREVMAWLSTDLGKRVTAAEEKASEPAQAQRLADAGSKALAKLPRARRALIERLVKATRAAEFNASLLIDTTVGVMRGIELVTPQDGDGPDTEDVVAGIEARKPALVEAMKAESAAAFAVAYESLRDADLEKYVRFAESPLGGRYHDVTSRALEAALADAAHEMGRQLGILTRRTEPRTRT
jgi:Uncharacterized protein conserved in bacteria (DUF2059)